MSNSITLRWEGGCVFLSVANSCDSLWMGFILSQYVSSDVYPPFALFHVSYDSCRAMKSCAGSLLSAGERRIGAQHRRRCRR